LVVGCQIPGTLIGERTIHVFVQTRDLEFIGSRIRVASIIANTPNEIPSGGKAR
jgi:hypothetical protein